MLNKKVLNRRTYQNYVINPVRKCIKHYRNYFNCMCIIFNSIEIVTKKKTSILIFNVLGLSIECVEESNKNIAHPYFEVLSY